MELLVASLSLENWEAGMQPAVEEDDEGVGANNVQYWLVHLWKKGPPNPIRGEVRQSLHDHVCEENKTSVSWPSTGACHIALKIFL